MRAPPVRPLSPRSGRRHRDDSIETAADRMLLLSPRFYLTTEARALAARHLNPPARRKGITNGHHADTTLGRTRGDSARAVHGDHGHLDHRRRAARDPGRHRLQLEQSVMGLQRLRDRLRRPAAARRSTHRPVRRQAHLQPRLGRPGRRIARRRAGQLDHHRDRRPSRARRRRSPDRAVRAHALDDALRVEPEGADQGLRRLRRSRPGGWYRRRLPRRRPDPVGLLAVGVLHQHPDRSGRAHPDAAPHAWRTGPSRVGRCPRRDHRHRRADADRARRGAGTQPSDGRRALPCSRSSPASYCWRRSR